MLMTVPHKNRMARILSLQTLFHYQFPEYENEKLFLITDLTEGKEFRLNQAFNAIHSNLIENPVDEILCIYGHFPLKKAVLDFAYQLIKGTLLNYADLEVQLKGHLTKGKLSSIPKIEHTILLQSLYELNFISSTPRNVVINEAIELAKIFGPKEGPGFINGLLDNLVKNQ